MMTRARSIRGDGSGVRSAQVLARRQLLRCRRWWRRTAPVIAKETLVHTTLLAYFVNIVLAPLLVAAQQIVADGRTQTTLSSSGSVTDVTTATISGSSAFNSFSKFDVNSGNTVNLHLPGTTSNLINVVTGERSDINGTLNSIKNSQVGGNVYFVNPHGLVVGSSGVVNVGSLSVTTSSQSFVDSFFSGGVPSSASTGQVLNGTVAVNEGATVEINGQVNALSDIYIGAGTVNVAGTVQNGASFTATSPTFTDVVNTNGYQVASRIEVDGGDIVLVGAGNSGTSVDVKSGGVVFASGGSVEIKSDSGVAVAGTVRGDASNPPVSELIESNGAVSIKAAGPVSVTGSLSAAASDVTLSDFLLEYGDKKLGELLVLMGADATIDLPLPLPDVSVSSLLNEVEFTLDDLFALYDPTIPVNDLRQLITHQTLAELLSENLGITKLSDVLKTNGSILTTLGVPASMLDLSAQLASVLPDIPLRQLLPSDGNIEIDATGNISFGSASSLKVFDNDDSGHINLYAKGSGAISFANGAQVKADGTAAGDGGSLDVYGATGVTLGTGTIDAGAIRIESGTSLTVSRDLAAKDGDIELIAAAGLSVDSGKKLSSLDSDSDAQAGDVKLSGSSVTLGGSATIEAYQSGYTGGALEIVSGTTVTLPSTTTIDARSIRIEAGGSYDTTLDLVAHGGNITLKSGDDIAISHNLTATSTDSGQGNISATASDKITVAANKTLSTVDSDTAGDIELHAAGLLDLGAGVSLLAEDAADVDDGGRVTLYGGGGLPLLASHNIRGGGYVFESGTSLSLPSGWSQLLALDDILTLKANGDITVPNSFKLSTVDSDGTGNASKLTVESNSTLNLGTGVQILAEDSTRVNDGATVRLYGGTALPLPGDLILRGGGLDLESGGNLSVPLSLGQGGELRAPDGDIRVKAGSTVTLGSGLTLTSLDTDGHGASGDITVLSGGALDLGNLTLRAEDSSLVDDGGKLTLRAGGVLTLPPSVSSLSYGSIDIETGSALTVPYNLTAKDGDIRVHSSNQVTISSGLTFSAVDSDGGGTAGDLDLYGATGVVLPSNFVVQAHDIAIGTGGSADLSVPMSLTALTDGDVHLFAGGSLLVGNSVTAALGDATLEAGGSVTTENDAPISAQNIFVDAEGNATFNANLTATEGWPSLNTVVQAATDFDVEDLLTAIGGMTLDLLVKSKGNVDIESGGTVRVIGAEVKAVGGNVDILSRGDLFVQDNGKVIASAGDFSLADLLLPDGEVSLRSTHGSVSIDGEVCSSTGALSLNVLVNALGKIGLLDILELIGDATVSELKERRFSIGDFVTTVAERFDVTIPSFLTGLLSTDSATVTTIVEDFVSSLFATLKLADFLNLGGDTQVIANNTLTVTSDSLISTRQISGTDFNTAVSTNDSGDIKLRGRNININQGSRLLAQVGEGTVLAAGDITMRVFDLDNVFDNIMTNFEAATVGEVNLDIIQHLTVDEIKLLAQDYFTNNDDSSARIVIDNSTIKGADLVASAVAMNVIGFDKRATAEVVLTGTNTIRADEVKMSTDVGTGLFNLAATLFDFSNLLYTQLPDGIPDEEVKQALKATELVSLDNIIPTEKLDFVMGFSTPDDIAAFTSYFTGATNELFYSRSQATSGVSLSSGTNLNATDDVTLTANTKTNSNANAPGYAISGGAARTDNNTYVELLGSTLQTTGDLTMSANTSAANGISVTPKFGTVNKPFNLTFAWNDMEVETKAEIASGSNVSAANIDIDAKSALTSSVASETKQVGGTNISLAGAASLIDAKSNAKVGGTVTATGKLTVDATTELPINVTNASSSSASAGLGVKIHNFQAKLNRLTSLNKYGETWRGMLGVYLNPKANAGKWNASGAVAYSDTDADATAAIHDGATVTVGSDLSLDAEVVDRPTNVAIAKSNTSGTNSFGGAVAIGTYEHDAAATIGSNANVNVTGDLDLEATSRIPVPWDFDYTDVPLIIARLQASPITFALTSYVENASAGSAKSGDSPTTDGQSAAVDVLLIDNRADAHIGAGAQINQAAGTHGDVTLIAEAERNIISAVGGNLLFFLDAQNSAKGASVNFLEGESTATAYIDDNADVDGTSLTLESEADSNVIAIAIAGGRANNTAMEGAATVVDSKTRATTYLGGGVDVNVSGDAKLDADASTRALVTAGGLVITKTGGKGSKGGGAAMSLALVTNEAETSLRDASGTRGSLVANNVNLGANTGTQIGSYSLAGMFTTSSGTGSGIDFVGDAAVNSVTSKATVSTDNWKIDPVLDAVLSATENSDIDAVSGALNLGTGGSDGLAGAAAFNMITKEAATVVVSDTEVDARTLTIAADVTSALMAISASARGSARGAGIAGATSTNQANIDSIAAIQDGSDVDVAGNLIVTADSTKDVLNVAGALAASTGSGRLGMGLGASVATNIFNATTDAYVDNSNVDVTNNGNVTVRATADRFEVESYGVAVGASTGEMVPAVATAVNEIVNKVRAYVRGAGKHLLTAGSAVIAAISNSLFRAVGGGLSATTQSGTFGGGAATNHHTDTVEAYVGDGVSIGAAGNGSGLTDASGATVKGLAVGAKSDDQFLTIAAGGAGSGGTSVAASVAVDLLNEDTKAWIGNSAKVNESNSNGATGQSVSVYAYDRTKTADGGGSLALGSTGGVGAGVGVVKLTKNTWANIGSSATVNAKQDVKAEALSMEDVTALSGAVAFGASVGIAGAGSGVGLTTTTDAHIGSSSTVNAGGTVLVSADDNSEVDVIAAAFEGAGAQVAVLDKNTYAYIGNSAVVKADGTAGSGVQARNGSFAVSHHAESGEAGEVEMPNLSIQSDSSVFKFNIPSERVATTNTQTVKGVAVSATNRDNLETLSVAGSAHLGGAVAIAAGVSVIDTDTKAYVGNGATVNADRSAAGTDQSVLIGAGNDVFHLGVSGAGSGAGVAGIGPGVEVTVLKNNTRAYADDNAKVNASKDIQVRSGSASEAVAFAAALGAGGTVGIAGAVSVLKEDNTTYAYVGSDAEAKAGGSVDIGADDQTYVDTLAGAAAVGFAGGAVGGSVVVTDITKDTRAFVGDRSKVDALGNASTLGTGLKVHANSREDVFAAMAAGSGGFYAGIGGAVAVDLIKSDTQAYIGSDADINQSTNTAANANQSVEVTASNETDLHVLGGSLGVSVVGGIAGTVDVGVVRNNTTARIGDRAEVDAKGAVQVKAESTKDASSRIVSAAGGTVAAAGAVGVYTLGDRFDSEAQNRITFNGSTATSYVDGQANDSTATNLLSQAGVNELSSVASSAATKKSGTNTGATVTSSAVGGTSAYTGQTAKVEAKSLSVKADEEVDFEMLTGAASIGSVGLGAGVGIGRLGTNASAFLGGGTQFTGTGDVSINAIRNVDASIRALAGTASLSGLDASYALLVDSGQTSADIGDGASILDADDVEVTANDVRDLDVDADGTSIALMGTAGTSIANAKATGLARASIGNNAIIGSSTDGVAGLTVQATTDASVDANTWAARGGLYAASSVNLASATSDLDTTASLGNSTSVNAVGNASGGAGDVKVLAEGKTDVNTQVTGWNVSAGLSAGGSRADSTATSDIAAKIGTSCNLKASRDVVLRSLYNSDESGNFISGKDSKASAYSSGGALVSSLGAQSTASTTANLDTFTGTSAKIDAGRDVKLLGRAGTWTDATADARQGGLVASGTTQATGTVNLTNDVYTGTSSEVDADGAVTLSGQTRSWARAYARGGLGGLFAGASTKAVATIHDTTTAKFGDSSSTEAVGDITAEAISRADTNSEGWIDTGGLVTSNLTEATSTNNQHAIVEVGTNAKIDGNNVTLRAQVAEAKAKAKAYSKTYAADSTTDARATISGDVDAKVTVKSGAEVTAKNKLTITAEVVQSGVRMETDAKATIGAGVTGVVNATSKNDLDIDADVDIISGAKLYSNEVSITAKAPKDKNAIWIRNADADAQTIVNYVVETIQVVKNVVTKVTSFLGFLGAVINWVVTQVLETVVRITEVVLHSSENAVTSGNYASDNNIGFNGDLYQSGAIVPELVVAQNGTITTQRNVDASVTGSEVVVNGIVNSSKAKVTLDATGGTLSGTGTIHHNQTFESISVVNNSDKDLRIRDIGVAVLDGNQAPDIVVYAQSNTSNFGHVTERNAPTAVTVSNLSGSDVIIDGKLSNLFGSINLTNSGGDILATSIGKVEGNRIALSAANGGIGNSTALAVDLVAQAGALSAPTLSAVAEDGIRVQSAVAEYLTTTPVAGYSVTGTVTGLIAGDGITLDATGKVVVVNSTVAVDEDGHAIESATSTHHVASQYNFTNTTSAGGDINLNGAADTTFNVVGSLRSGFQDIAVNVDASGNATSSPGDYIVSNSASAVEVGAIANQGGHIHVTGQLSGTGSLNVLNGYRHVTVSNASSKDLILGDIDVGAIQGVVTLNGIDKTVPGSIGSLALAGFGYSSGLVSVASSLSAADVLVRGAVHNPGGITNLTSAGGIDGSNSTHLLTAKELVLGAATTIGSAQTLRTQVGTDGLTATSTGNTRLSQIAGDLWVNDVTANSGDVTLTSANSILDGEQDNDRRVKGRMTNLTATAGSIGSASDRFEIDSQGATTATAQAGVYIGETAGDLSASVVAGTDADLTAAAGGLTAAINAGNDARVSNVRDAATVTINAGRDAVVDGVGTILSANTVVAGRHADIRNVGGNAALGVDADQNVSVTDIGGNLTATVLAGGDVLAEDVQGSVTAALTAGNDIVLSQIGGAVTSTTLDAGRDARLSDVTGAATVDVDAGRDATIMQIGTGITADIVAGGNASVADVGGNASVTASSGQNASVQGIGGNLLATLTSVADSLIRDVMGTLDANVDSGASTTVAQVNGNTNLNVDADGSVDVSQLGAGLQAQVASRGAVHVADVMGKATLDVDSAQDTSVTRVGGDVDATIVAGGDASVSQTGRDVDANVTASRDVTFTAITRDLAAVVHAGRDLSVSNVGGAVDLNATTTANSSLGSIGGSLLAGITAGGNVDANGIQGDVSVTADAGGNITLDQIAGAISSAALEADGSIAVTNVGANANVDADSGQDTLIREVGGSLHATVVSGSDVRVESIRASATVQANAMRDILVHDVDGAATANLVAGGSIVVSQLGSTANIDARAGVDARIASVAGNLMAQVVAGNDAKVEDAGGDAALTVKAGHDILVQNVAGSISMGTLVAANNATVQSVAQNANLTVESGQSTLVSTIGGNLSALVEAGLDARVVDVAGNVSLGAEAAQDILVDDVDGAAMATLVAGRDVTVSNVDLGAVVDVTAGHDARVQQVGGDVAAVVEAENDATLQIVVGNVSALVDAARDVRLSQVMGAVSSATLTAGRDAFVNNVGLDATIDVTSGLQTQVANVGGNLSAQIDAGTDVRVQDVGGNVTATVTAGQDILLTRVTKAIATLDAGRNVTVTNIGRSANVVATSGNDTLIARVAEDVNATVEAGNDATLTAVGGSAVIDLDAGHDANLQVIDGSVNGQVAAGNDALVEDVGGSVTLQAAAGQDYLVHDVAGSVTTQATAGRFVDIARVGGDVRVDADAGSDVTVASVGRDIYAGMVNSNTGNVEMTAGAGSVFVGRIAAANRVDLDAWAGIVEKDNDTATDLLAKDIHLQARGTIGSADEPIEIDSSRGGAGTVTALSGLGVHLVEVDGDLTLADVRATNGDIGLRASTGSIQLGHVVASGGGASLFAAGAIRSAGDGTTDLEADRIVLITESGDIGSELVPLLINSGSSRASGVEVDAGGGAFLTELTDDLRVDSIAAGGPVHVNVDRSIVATRPDTRIVSGGGLQLTAQRGSLGNAASSLHVAANGSSSLQAAGDVYLLSDTRLDLSQASAAGTLSLEVVQGGLDADQLAAPIIGILVRDGNASIRHVTTGSLKTALQAEGSELHLTQLNLTGTRPTASLLADRILVDDSSATAGRKVSFDLRGNDGLIADLVNLRAPFARLFFTHLHAAEANLDLDNALRQRVKFRDLVILNRANIHAGQVDVLIGAGDATPFRLYITRARIKVRGSGQRTIQIMPRPLQESAIESLSPLAVVAVEESAS